MDRKFKQGTINQDVLEKLASESARLYGKLRYVHLRAHLAMMEILSRDQVKKYGELRGYGSGDDPCKNVPEGHDPKMWKSHHGCG